MLKINLFKYFYIIAIIVTSFSVVYYSGNRGVFPIDTFTFFESGYLILNDYHPIKDFWIISGITGDYIQAFLFKIFGVNWNSYLLHSGLLNAISAAFFFIFLKNYNLKLFESFIFSISFTILNYPVSGTPFTYLDAYNFSLISIFIFFLGILKKNNLFFFILPFFMGISFLSMQLPSGLINLFLIFSFLVYFFILNKNHKAIFFFIIGSLATIILFFIYLFIINIPFKDFLIQYILFPLSFGVDRISSEVNGFESAKLLNKINFKNIFFDFKHIHFFLITFYFLLFIEFKKSNKKILEFIKNNFIDIILIFFIFSFVFHQLITANQIFIFSLIPILAAFTYKKVNYLFEKKIYLRILIIILLLFSTFKFHKRFNIERKFMELQNFKIDLLFERANLIDARFKSLKWVNPSFKGGPKEEIKYLIDVKEVLAKTNQTQMLITHYQFFSILTSKELNIPNRWYFPHNTFPTTSENVYYSDYLKFINKKIVHNKIETISIVMEEPKKWVDIYSKIFENQNCIKKTIINPIFTKLDIRNCVININ